MLGSTWLSLRFRSLLLHDVLGITTPELLRTILSRADRTKGLKGQD